MTFALKNFKLANMNLPRYLTRIETASRNGTHEDSVPLLAK